MTVSAAREEFFSNLMTDLLYPGLFSVASFFLSFVLHREADMMWWLITALVVVGGAYVALLHRTMSALSRYALHQSFGDLCRRHEELRGLIDAWTGRALDDISAKIDALANDGIVWTGTQRIESASLLLEGTDDIPSYLATSTDAPYNSSSEAEAFDRLQRTKLRHANVQRLLLYPLRQLINGLEDRDQRRRAALFLGLHTTGDAQRGRTINKSFQLRYLPTDSLADLKTQLSSLTGDIDPLVDMAVIGDSLVFGQGISDPQTFPADGRGFIIPGQGKASAYRKAFERIWAGWKDRMYPTAQIYAWIHLLEMRESMRLARVGQSGLTPESGRDFFEYVVKQICESNSLCAIDVADSTRSWFEKQEYRQFHVATCEAARAHFEGEFQRIFVLRDSLDPLIANAFCEEVLKEEVDAGVHVFLVYAKDLLTQNLAALDCIFAQRWGFYLSPTDSFNEVTVSRDCNWMDPDAAIPYFEQMFQALKASTTQEPHAIAN